MANSSRSPAIIFDLGKVLLDFSYTKVAETLSGRCRVSQSEIVQALQQSPLLLRYETNAISTEEFFAEMQAVSGFSGGLADFKPIFADIFTPIEPMIQLQAELRSSGYPVYIFSNTNFLAVEHIRERYPFFRDFDGYILSCEHGLMKPDPGIYEIVEQSTDRSGPELVYLDDREENIATAEKRGWRAIHHRTPEESRAKLKEFGVIGG